MVETRHRPRLVEAGLHVVRGNKPFAAGQLEGSDAGAGDGRGRHQSGAAFALERTEPQGRSATSHFS